VTADYIKTGVIYGDIVGGGADDSAMINCAMSIGRLSIGGSVVGGAGSSSAGIAAGNIGTVIVNGSVSAGTGAGSGSISVAGDIGTAIIRGSLDGNGNVNLESPGVVVPIQEYTIYAGGNIGRINVQKSIDGLNNTVVIAAQGSPSGEYSASKAIGSVEVGGSVNDTDILAGFSETGAVTHGSVEIGSVLVGGNWSGSSISAGVEDVTGDGYGNEYNARVLAPDDSHAISEIAKIVVNGQIVPGDDPGTGTQLIPGVTNGQFGWVAQEIGYASIDGVVQPLHPGPENDDITITVEDNTILSIYEVVRTIG
jgi:hypothetical protein